MRLSELIKRLVACGIENARGEALILFRHFTDFPEYVLRLCDPDSNNPELLKAMCRRLQREPLQYILGECAFFDEVYEVNPAVLIPRSDTEILVEAILKELKSGSHLLDLCTGSGCVAISSLLHSDGTRATLVDLSEDALAMARKNAAKYHLDTRVEFLLMDILKDFPLGEYDVIASNPPYIPEADYQNLAPEIFAEPRMAFVADDEGMAFYRAILQNGREHLKKDGVFLFEIGFNQEESIKALAKEYHLTVKIIYDLSNNARVALIR